MAIYEMKYMYDWRSGVCVWSTNSAAREKYGYPVASNALPISQALIDTLNDLIARYDTALNWDNPASGLVWSAEEQSIWFHKAKAAYERLCLELGNQYTVTFEAEL